MKVKIENVRVLYPTATSPIRKLFLQDVYLNENTVL